LIFAGNGLLEGSVGSQLVITGNTGPIYFSPGKGVLRSLSLLANASLSLDQPLEICAGSNPGFLSLGNNAILNSNGFLILASDEMGSACIKPIGSLATINGAVEVQRYIPGGRRNFRFLAHPFSQSLGLSALTNDLDITGVGGSLNGFTSTATNNPSAFYYDPLKGDGSSADPGWIAFNHTNGINPNAWSPMQGIRINVRGKKGEGLNGVNYIPSPVVLHPKGNINLGNQLASLTKSGTNPGFNLIGNPYPSSIDMSKLVNGANIASSYYVWDPNQGTKGGYSCYLFSNPLILPAFAAFFVQTSNANSENTILFTENAKVSGINPIKLTGMGNPVSDQLEISIQSDSIFWDRQLFLFSDSASDQMDFQDAPKMINPELNFYSLSANQEKLSIDARRKETNLKIPVYLETKLEKTFQMKALNVPVSMIFSYGYTIK